MKHCARFVKNKLVCRYCNKTLTYQEYLEGDCS